MDFVQDYYAILGVSPDASEQELREAWEIAAQRFHPDTNEAPGAPLLFQGISTAYEVLSDPQRRSEYDRAFSGHAEPYSLSVQTYYSRRHLKPLDEAQLLYILVKIQPSVGASQTPDAPLNLGLVVDRSKSMMGDRLQYLKAAAHRIVDECGPEDIISVVTFSDRAEVVVPAQRATDRRGVKASISTIRADGATAIYAGLRLGMNQIGRYHDSQYVNHIVLITDGRTYGDEEQCLELADEAHEKGIGISGMGIGEDWNDDFLDALASRTGGASAYIISAEEVTQFLHNRIRSLATAYAERSRLTVAPPVGVQLDSLVRVSPNPMTLSVDSQPIALGTIDGLSPMMLMLQFHVNINEASQEPFYVGRIEVGGEVLGVQQRAEKLVEDLYVETVAQDVEEEPPPELLDALSKLTLHRLQDRAREALAEGNIAEATRKLEILATRLFERGEENLGQAALQEARIVTQTHMFSEEGAKRLKYGTRALLPVETTLFAPGDD